MRPFKVICVSIYDERAGHTRMTRSALIRLAVDLASVEALLEADRRIS